MTKKIIKIKENISEGISPNTSLVPQENKNVNLDKIKYDEVENTPYLIKNNKVLPVIEKKKKYIKNKENRIENKKRKNFIDMNLDGIPDDKNDSDLSQIIFKRRKIKIKKKEKRRKELEDVLEREKEIKL